MPYSTTNLNADESVVLDQHPHWWSFAGPASATVGTAIIAVLLISVSPDGFFGSLASWAGGLVVFVAVAWLVTRLAAWRTTDLVVTSHRIIFRHGVVGKSGIEIPLDRVNNVNFHQSVIERMLGAGDLLIESGGEQGQSRFSDVRQPDAVQNLIHAQVEALRQRRSGGGGFAPPATTPDVTAQLERLEGLKSRGTISQAEFDLQKHRLLGS